MSAQERSKSALPFVAISIPVVAFYLILFAHLLNLPLQDDYDVVLDFANHVIRGPGNVRFLLASQHNEHKLIFAQLIVWLQVLVLHKVNFKILCAVGDLFVLAIAAILWKAFLPGWENNRKLILFAPIAFLLFQLQYVETLNWTVGGLQNIPALFFSLATIYLLTRKGARHTASFACVCLPCAIASSGSGLLLIPLGVVTLAENREKSQLALWLAASAVCLTAYFHTYTFVSIHGHINPLFVLAFLGSALSVPRHDGFLLLSALACPVLGLALCIFFVHNWRALWANRFVFYGVTFIFLNALTAARSRAELGYRQSLSSRYGIYSAILLIFAWFLIAERNSIKRIFRPLALAITFSLCMDIAGYRYLISRNQALIEGALNYKLSASDNPTLPFSGRPSDVTALQRRAPIILETSRKLGVYSP